MTNNSNKKEIILTGDRPTGSLHIGHYVGSLKKRVELQNLYKQFVMIADTQALTDNFENPQKIRDNLYEVLLDYLAVGIDPKISTIFVQSMIPELAELTMYYMNLVTISRLERNPTVKNEIREKNFEKSLPAGFFCYPVSQAADITAFKATVVPVGDDQLPMIEQANEIVRRFNRIYKTDVLKESKAVLSDATRLCGIDGNAKMSKSLGNGIYIKDTPDIIKKKVMSMFTDPNHIHVNDPGKVEGNVVFTYLDVFDPNKEEVEELKTHYKRGGLGDVKIKRRLIDVLVNILEPMQNVRNEYAKDPLNLEKILKEGTERARETASKTMSEVKQAIGINYF